MDSRTLRVLEYEKIKERLARCAATEFGRELALKIRPLDDLEAICRFQRETSEAKAIERERGTIPFAGISDIRRPLKRARAGGVLNPEELVGIACTLRGAQRLRSFLLGLHEEFALLRGYAREIASLGELTTTIFGCIGEDGEILDDASPALSQIRRQLRVLDNRVKDKLDSMIRSPEFLRYLQEPIVTLRNGRFVVPVKQAFRTEVPGILHDQSASGQTLFVEPMVIVELNNELRRLRADEEAEIERILTWLSSEVAKNADSIEETIRAVTRIDLAVAKGRLSLEYDGTEPTLNCGGRILIRQGRHPLLTGEAVPIDVTLGQDFTTLVITGPNTGGKTVALKTIGLLTLMAQSGLHVPAAPGTELAVFRKVFADIGDEQSIEQSLSTFSSHMGYIVKILQRLGDRGEDTLVLLDELGAGTDPQEGAALAMAILEFLHGRDARVVATTHYSELKAFAHFTEGARNASVEFDDVTLAPTYRLLIGVPGRSNAFVIASRLGLFPEIIEAARSKMGGTHFSLENMLSDIERTRRELEEERDRARSARLDAEKLRASYEKALAALMKERSEIIQKAREEVRDLVRRSRDEARAVLDTLRKERAAKPEAAYVQARRALDGIAEEIEELVNESYEETGGMATPSGSCDGRSDDLQGAHVPFDPERARVGMEVYVPRLGRTGILQTLPDSDGRCLVQLGMLKIPFSTEELMCLGQTSPRESGAVVLGELSRSKASDISVELDLRGLRVEEALSRVDKYLDDAYLAGIPRARIIHGKGTGALRQAIQDMLKRHPHVSEFRFGAAYEGGDGVTVVSLNRP